ncbi:MAG: lytic murein transglycosylase [Rhodospirillales bacterium]|nr:lytic murein transglycosylase [Rhodospirillales bacterium]
MQTAAIFARALASIALVLAMAALAPLHGAAAEAAASVADVPGPAADGAAVDNDDFANWLAEVRGEAARRGVSATLADAALSGITPLDRVLELDRRQPEFSQTFWQYLDKRVTEQRIERGRQMLTEHADLLEATARRHGVQPRFIVAFWALESNFGDYTGNDPAVAAIATLAYDKRRSSFFREQLLALLEEMDDGDIPLHATGSWAGALGQTQFIPTTYRRYAVDADGDGRRDLWGSLADVFASTANYLAAAGWDDRRTWGREVSLPAKFDLTLSGLETEKPLAEWQRLGVRGADGQDLPAVDLTASLILPGGLAGGPALLVYPNFRTIMAWNRSILYAVAVGHLSDRLAGGDAFRTPPPENEVALSRADLIEIQSRLGRLGFDIGEADGIVGPQTRRAIMNFQQEARLPADGYPGVALLDTIRRVSAE